MWRRSTDDTERGREDETVRVICPRQEKSRDNAGDEADLNDPDEGRQGVAPRVRLGFRLRNGSTSNRFLSSNNISCVRSCANDPIPICVYPKEVASSAPLPARSTGRNSRWRI